MANPFRGQAELVVTNQDGSTRTLVLRAGMNEMATLQKLLEVDGFNDIVNQIRNMSITGIRTIFRVLLSKQNPKMTAEQAGDLIDQVGVPEVIRITSECLIFSLNGPDRGDKEAEPAADAGDAAGEADPNAQ